MTTATLNQTFFIECRSRDEFLTTEVRELWTWFIPHFTREDELMFVSMLVIGPLMIGWQEPIEGEPIYAGVVDWLAAWVRRALG